MGTTYIIHEGHEYYDENEGDARGYPVKKWHSSGGSFETSEEPKVGDSWMFEENGKVYRRVIQSVHSRGMVWEDTEELDVEYHTYEVKPDEFFVEQEHGHYGIINGLKEVVVPYEYDFIATTHKKNFVKVKKNGGWGILNCYNGEIVIPIGCEDILYLKGYPTCWMVRKDGVWMCYDDDFHPSMLNISQFEKVCDLEDGLVAYKAASDSLGVVDSEKNIILPFAYKQIKLFGDGLIYAYSKQKTEDYEQQNGIYYIYNFEGKELWRWDMIAPLKDGMAMVCLTFWKKKYGYINSKAELIVRPMFDKLSDFNSKGYAEGVIGYNSRFRVYRTGRIEIAPFSYIESHQYKGIFDLKEVNIPDDIKIFESCEGSFENCSNLKSVHISNSDKHDCISERMFSGCKSLETIEIPESVTTIGECAFRGCESLSHIDLPLRLEVIKSGAFSSCDSMETITIPASVSKIEEGGGLRFCNKLKEIIVDPANQHYSSHDGVLYDVSGNELLVYPINKKEVDRFIPNTVQAIRGDEVQGEFERLFIPYSVHRIGGYALNILRNNENLKEIIVSPISYYFASLDGVLYDREGKCLLLYPRNKEEKEFLIPDTVLKLERKSFHCCNHLERIVIPNSVTRFSEWAFFCCDQLKEVVMPDTIQHFEHDVFFIHNSVRQNLTIIISRKVYGDIQKYLPKGVGIIFKD